MTWDAISFEVQVSWKGRTTTGSMFGEHGVSVILSAMTKETRKLRSVTSYGSNCSAYVESLVFLLIGLASKHIGSVLLIFFLPEASGWWNFLIIMETEKPFLLLTEPNMLGWRRWVQGLPFIEHKNNSYFKADMN